MYIQSPLTGMTENEMINEARIRIQHNKQRQRLKSLLATAANGGSIVATKDLLLACRLAKLDMSAGSGVPISDEHVVARTGHGLPTKVQWEGFTQSLNYPELHGPGDFPGELPYTRRQKAQIAEYKKLQEELQVAAESGKQVVEVKDEVKDDEIRYWHKTLKACLETRFSEIRRAFRLIDADNSGSCDRPELKNM